MEVFFHSNEENPTKLVLDFFRGTELVKFICVLLNGIYYIGLQKKGLGSPREDAWTLERQIIRSVHEAGCFSSLSLVLKMW